MINLVSTCAGARRVTGPVKVFANLAKGLDRIAYPYVVNRTLDSTSRLWVHDDLEALLALGSTLARTVIGPNLFVDSRLIPESVSLEGRIWIQPSAWPIELWKSEGFARCAMYPWPVGIDLDDFVPSRAPARPSVLVYHKGRREAELRRIQDALTHAGLPFEVLRYGAYREDAFKSALARSSLVVWHGCHESQGIALLEALAADVPVLVCDVERLSEATGGHFGEELDWLRVTSAPYFDERCGLRTRDLEDVGRIAVEMIAARGRYAPRSFVADNLSLERQARSFVELWEHFGLTAAEGRSEAARSDKPFRSRRNKVATLGRRGRSLPRRLARTLRA